MSTGRKIFEVNHLSTSFFVPAGEVKAVNNVSYHLNEQEIIAIVGESGCGKTVSQLSSIQLIQSPPGKIVGGEVIFDGKDLLKIPSYSKEIRSVRGAGIAMIFQEPMTSLNPVYTVGNQLIEVIRTHRPKLSKREAFDIGVESLKKVGIPEPATRMKSYSFQMSGGMRQRVMIATALACQSKIIIADDPTNALDVTTQAQVMELLRSIVSEFKTSIIVSTHNLGLVTRYAERVYVMYAGKIIESGTTEEIVACPKHPYTLGLLQSVPKLNGSRTEDLAPITGTAPMLNDLPNYCTFFPRCPKARKECKEAKPPLLRAVGNSDQCVACHLN
jgi:oligopeptide/dipeptide ABC transporter ATP-binding protein